MCLMKSQAYRPSHDRIIIPNASSKHFKGHFIPVPTPQNMSQQSRWPDLNQVPLAGLWCPTPSDQQDICRANSIRFTLVPQKCMDLSLSDTTAHSFASARARMSHVDTEESSGATQNACTLRNTCEQLSPCVTSRKCFFCLFSCLLGCGCRIRRAKWKQMKITMKSLKWPPVAVHPIFAPLRRRLAHNLMHSGRNRFETCLSALAQSSSTTGRTSGHVN